MSISPLTLTPSQGEIIPIIGGPIRILLDHTSSAGQCVVFESDVPPGDGPPLHCHQREDELFYVLCGRFKFSLNGTLFFAEPGAFVFAPRGSLHTFRNISPEPSRLLVTCTPAGIETAFRDIQFPPPGSSKTPPTMDDIIARLAAHGITFHGPPLSE